MKLTRLASGEYEFKGGTISKDENEANLWWLWVDGYNFAEDFRTLKEAKLSALIYIQEDIEKICLHQLLGK
tara:strand:+ start:258 stop:470 length:213 start_codon:yes stop_codon:yes gene_type:complete